VAAVVCAATGLAAVVSPEAVSFWKNCPGATETALELLDAVEEWIELVVLLVVAITDDDDDEDEDVVVWVLELVELVDIVLLVVGVGVADVVDVVEGGAVVEVEVGVTTEDEGAPPDGELEESPALKTTRFALLPVGTVTTQKPAPPAPSADSDDVTVFIALTDGSIEHGRPLHPPPSHSILIPQVGIVLTKSESM